MNKETKTALAQRDARIEALEAKNAQLAEAVRALAAHYGPAFAAEINVLLA